MIKSNKGELVVAVLIGCMFFFTLLGVAVGDYNARYKMDSKGNYSFQPESTQTPTEKVVEVGK